MQQDPSPPGGSRARPYITAALLFLTGFAMALPGIYLAALGGSIYYLIAGLAIVVSGVLVFRRDARGAYLYYGVLAVTIVWALIESGLDGWALMPRLVFLAVGGLWLALPAVRAKLFATPARARGALLAMLASPVVALAVVVLGFVAMPVMMQKSATFPDDPANAAEFASEGINNGEWTHTGNSAHGTRFSTLDQIKPTNVADLEKAWTYHSGIKPKGAPSAGGLEVTPIMVNNVMYGCTAYSSVFALDPTTGKVLWRHDPEHMDYDGITHAVCRGVTYYKAPAGVTNCPERILLGTVDNRLIALDAKTGKYCKGFGTNGQVDLLKHMGKFPKGWTYPTSPPTIIGDTAVIGAYVIDNQQTDVPPGVIRGYDAVTGKLKWVFDADRPNDHKPLTGDATYSASSPNSWTVFSADPKLGLVYVPMGNGSPDFFAGKRSKDTMKYATSVVALDGKTGEIRWHFQPVHKDLWDYDLAAQPVLTDFPTKNGTVPALIQPTKTGQIFVLDRRTGKPLTKVEEKQVPKSTLPGQVYSPTQPFSTGMPSFIGPLLTGKDMWGITPFDQLYCRIKFQQADYQGPFTPMSLKPSVRMPGELGGIDWGSVSVDEKNHVMIVNSNRMPDYDQLITRAEANREGLVPKADPRGENAPGGAMAGTPYGTHWGVFLTGLGVPCQEPPYGYLTAVDLKTHKVLWKRTIGNATNAGPFGIKTHLPLPLGAPNIGGSIVTKGGLIFMAATQDQYMRAIDEKSGKVLWKVKLPAGGHATPMTYMGKDGHQYVVIAAGGNTSMQTALGDSFIAYRLK